MFKYNLKPTKHPPMPPVKPPLRTYCLQNGDIFTISLSSMSLLLLGFIYERKLRPIRYETKTKRIIKWLPFKKEVNFVVLQYQDS